jgi:hypothetical protein
MEFHMSPNEPEIVDLDADERRLFASLPREMSGGGRSEDELVSALRAEGFLRPRTGMRSRWYLAAAAVLLVAVAAGSGVVGARIATRSSLEATIARDDLSVADRILVLQRAGSAYVQAAHAYADATAKTDSTAVEVAEQVLRGAAHAVARSDLDGGVAQRITSVLQTPVRRTASQTAPVIWF